MMKVLLAVLFLFALALAIPDAGSSVFDDIEEELSSGGDELVEIDDPAAELDSDSAERITSNVQEKFNMFDMYFDFCNHLTQCEKYGIAYDALKSYLENCKNYCQGYYYFIRCFISLASPTCFESYMSYLSSAGCDIGWLRTELEAVRSSSETSTELTEVGLSDLSLGANRYCEDLWLR
eukprot:JP447059.1.p1 GENE.JP447059.1~~JP447059.1.p1  ORF type:complete len:179 (-),score=11.84 JP447059.1:124-660(-)